jgi:hypothetical protein
LAEIAAGVLGTAATWVASTGAGVAVWERRCADKATGWGLWGQARVFWGELRWLACSGAYQYRFPSAFCPQRN